jgi:hypothetical protein
MREPPEPSAAETVRLTETIGSLANGNGKRPRVAVKEMPPPSPPKADPPSRHESAAREAEGDSRGDLRSIRHWRSRGLSRGEIARRLHIDVKTVRRRRDRQIGLTDAAWPEQYRVFRPFDERQGGQFGEQRFWCAGREAEFVLLEGLDPWKASRPSKQRADSLLSLTVFGLQRPFEELSIAPFLAAYRSWRRAAYRI